MTQPGDLVASPGESQRNFTPAPNEHKTILSDNDVARGLEDESTVAIRQRNLDNSGIQLEKEK